MAFTQAGLGAFYNSHVYTTAVQRQKAAQGTTQEKGMLLQWASGHKSPCYRAW